MKDQNTRRSYLVKENIMYVLDIFFKNTINAGNQDVGNKKGAHLTVQF